MAVDVFGGGPVQPGLVAYRFIDLTANLQLFWPSSYLDTVDVVAANMNVTNPVATDFTISMPNATQVGVGTQCVFTNIGNSNFEMKTFEGDLIRTAEPGTAYYLYLTDNSTPGGTWTSLVYGGTTSSASAADLAGFGLVALPHPPGIATLNTDVVTITTHDVDFNPGIDNRSNLIVWTGGADDIDLPALDGGDAGYYLSFNNQGSGLWRIIPTPPALFDGETDIEVNFGQSLTAVWDGTNWYSLGFGQDLIFPFTVLNKNISGNTNVTLTAGEGANQVLQFNHAAGDLTGNVIIFMPSRVEFQWVVYNNTTGAFNLSIQQTDGSGGGTGTIYIIPQGNRQTFYNDGTTLYNFPTVVEISDTATFPSGTLGAPGIAFTDSPSTGLRRPAANTISVVAGGVDGIVVDSTTIALEHTTAVNGSISVTDRTTTLDNIAPAAPALKSLLTYNGTHWIAGGIPIIDASNGDVASAGSALTNTTYAAIAGMTFTGTPSSIHSGFLIFVNLNISCDQVVKVRLMRDATPIAIGTAGNTLKTAVSATYLPYSITFLDTPATTSAIIYTVEAALTTAGTYYINRDMASATAPGFSSISYLEIGGF